MKTKTIWQHAASMMIAMIILVTPIFASADPAFARPASAACASHYTVKSGDTLSKIASAYKITLTQLANANSIKSPYTIYVGQSLCIPEGATVSGDSPTTTTTVPSLTATKSKETLSVQVKNYPKNTGYFIRVKPTTGTTWEKVGALYIDGKGNGKSTVTLKSNQLIKSAQLDVCLKNIINGKLNCTKTTAPVADNDTPAALSFTASVQGKYLTVHANKAPKNATYFVRISQQKTGGNWEKIGYVKVDAKGNLDKTFNLPSNFSNWTILHVCLKNAETDAVVCVKLTR